MMFYRAFWLVVSISIVTPIACSKKPSSSPFQSVWTNYEINAGVFTIAFQGTQIWVGTDQGLIRYDLIEDRVVQKYDSQNGLVADIVTVVKVDPQGHVWAGTHGGGLDRFDGKQWKNFNVPDLADPYVYDLLFDREGRMWVANWKGVSIYDGHSTSGGWHSFTKADGIVDDWVYAMAMDKDGIVWVGTEGGVSRYDGKSWVSYSHEDGLGAELDELGEYEKIPNPSFHHRSTEGKEAEGYNPNYILAAAVDAQNVKWFGTWGAGLSRYDGKNWKNYTTRDGLPGNFISDILVDPEATLWIATEGGVGMFDHNRWRIFTRHDGMVDDSVFTANIDARGFKWFGTMRGISKLEGLFPASG
jgi:ligand-binding sensor domain-containing protein